VDSVPELNEEEIMEDIRIQKDPDPFKKLMLTGRLPDY